MARPLILLDIEGTTSRIAFVKEVLFPYAREALPRFVAERGEAPEVARWLDAVAEEIAADAGREAEGDGGRDVPSAVDGAGGGDARVAAERAGAAGRDVADAAERAGAAGRDAVVAALVRWIDEDRKHTALKALQGMIWAKGYADGAYRAHVYPDAVEALSRWQGEGRPVHLYSSGSVRAQKLFFAHSEAGDLTGRFAGHFDTEIGGKKDPESYRRIVAVLGVPAAEVLFCSDVIEELDAARVAGLGTVLVDRPEDYPEPRTGEASRRHRRVTTLDALP